MHGSDLHVCGFYSPGLVVILNALTLHGDYANIVNMSRQVVPNKTQMRRYLTKGLTQQQIVEAWEADSGVKVSRAAIAMAISRYELKSTNARPRYEDTLPWKIKSEHQNDHNARMLRLEGRRRRGLPLSVQEKRWLDGYMTTLKQHDVVVTYVPDLPEGFVWVPRNEWDDDMVRRTLRNAPKEEGAKKRSTRAAG